MQSDNGLLAARLGLLLLARPVHTANDTFFKKYLFIISFAMQRYVIRDTIKHCRRSSKIKPTNISEWKAILKNKIAKILKIAQLQKLPTSKICTY